MGLEHLTRWMEYELGENDKYTSAELIEAVYQQGLEYQKTNQLWQFREIWHAHYYESILLFEHDAPSAIAAALEKATTNDPHQSHFYMLYINQSMGKNATYLVQQGIKSHACYPLVQPLMAIWFHDLLERGIAKGVSNPIRDVSWWFELHHSSKYLPKWRFAPPIFSLDELEAYRSKIWQLEKTATETIPLQHTLFGNKPVDNRSRSQKRKAKKKTKPQPVMMFSQRDVAQFGVKAKPLISLSPKTKLVLRQEDPRTEEEIEKDIRREAEAKNHQIFEAEPESNEKATRFCNRLIQVISAQPDNMVALFLLVSLVKPKSEDNTKSTESKNYTIGHTPNGLAIRKPILPRNKSPKTKKSFLSNFHLTRQK